MGTLSMVGFDFEKHPTGVFFYAQDDAIELVNR